MVACLTISSFAFLSIPIFILPLVDSTLWRLNLFLFDPHDGDLDTGHQVLDQWIKDTRANTVDTLKKLPGPAKN